MELKTSKSNRRIGVILNFICITSIVLLFELIKLKRNPTLLIYELIPLVILVIGYIIYFGKTGLWKFTHKSLNDLDERELQLSNKSLRFSYIIFTIFTLGLFLIYSVIELNINMVLVVSLLYLAHILPSYFISWTEESVSNED
ncbi:MAG: hypothetical protein KOO66_10590 [Bacteroidales bacterium]|nr:hypothetical protein [Bacteroidales bacterium]